MEIAPAAASSSQSAHPARRGGLHPADRGHRRVAFRDRAIHARVGRKCLVALDGKRVAGFNLVSFERIHLPVVHYRRPWVRTRPSRADHVSRDYRGKGLAATLRFEIFRALKPRENADLRGHRSEERRQSGAVPEVGSRRLPTCAT